MKKLIATTLLAVVPGLMAFAQGTVTFANAGVGLNAPVFHSDGTTKLAATTYEAILMGGATAGALAQYGSTASFIGAGAPGYFNGGAATISTVAPGSTGFFQVIVWDSTLGNTTTGATEAEAVAYAAAGHGDVIGFSTIFQNTTGGVGSPATPPATLTGLTSFSLNPVPEPATFALAGLGAAAALIFRRRK